MSQVLEELLSKASKDHETLTSSFWYGKFLQCLAKDDPTKRGVVSTILGRPLHEHVEEARKQLRKCHTSLSPYVHFLVTQSIPPLCDCCRCYDNHCLDDDYTLNWSFVQMCVCPCFISLSPISLFTSSQQPLACNDYTGLAIQLGCHLAMNVHGTLGKTLSDDVVRKWTLLFQWTHSPQVYKECCELLSSGESHLSLLLCTAAIERSLGDVYLYISAAAECPHLMRDLLATEELIEVFGELPMLCLRGLIGPPGGLNLRNIVWHGFAEKNEIPEQYVFLLLVMVASLGKIFQEKFGADLLISHCSFVSFPHELVMKGVFPEYSDVDFVSEIFEDTYFIVPSMLPIWKSAISYFKKEKYGHCLCILLPALEHSLRRIFACCNGCPERVLTAEATTLYTTFDEILSPTLEDGSTVNALADEIGHQNMNMLMDLIVYPEGPKLRDRISHGEVDLSSVSATLAGHVLSMCTACCLRYTISYKPVQDSTADQIRAAGERYVSLFHPLSLLQREVSELACELEKWKEMETFVETDNEEGQLSLCTLLHPNFTSTLSLLTDRLLLSFSSSHIPDCEFISKLSKCFHGDALLSLIRSVWDIPRDTLFLPRHQMELIGLLRRVTSHLSTGVKQVMKTALQRYHLYQRKELRSRQRTNFDRLLSCIGTYWSASVLVGILVCSIVAVSHDQSHDSTKMIKYLKKVLQFCENFSSLTSVAKNRWEEAERLCSTFISNCYSIIPSLV